VSCEEKARLAKEYDAATFAFAEVVTELHRKAGTSPKEEYKRLERISTEASVKSEQARLGQDIAVLRANSCGCGRVWRGHLYILIVDLKSCFNPESRSFTANRHGRYIKLWSS
jgi:hypothetical protein